MDRKEMKEVSENCSDTQRKITWDTSSKEKGYVHNHSTDLLEIPLATNHTMFSKSDDRMVTDLTVEELKNIIKTEILMNVLPYLNTTQTISPNIGTDIRTWIDPNKEPYKTWMQHKDKDIY